ncbi:MAG: hypothetical protein ACXAB2_03495 [Candidatus Hodarchaeales archaeon]|jgi:phosphoserine phosphatase
MESELKTGFNITGSLIVFDFDGTITTSRYRSSWQSVHEYFDTWESHGKKALQDFIDDKINYYEFCKADAYPWIKKHFRTLLMIKSTIMNSVKPMHILGSTVQKKNT